MTSSYQGISQGNSGFNPDPTPDYTTQIQQRNQELQRSLDRFNDSVNANDAARLANAERAGDTARALGKLSATAAKVLGGIQTERIKKFQNEAKLLKAAGLDTPEKIEAARQEQDRQEEELRETNAELNKVKDKMVKNQEPFNVIDDVGKLNGYHIAELNRLNIIEQSKTYDQGVKDYIAEQIQSGRDNSPDAQVGYAKEYTSQFLFELQDYSSPLIAKYALPFITQGQDKRIQAIRTQQAQDVSAQDRENATTKLLETSDLEAYLNTVRYTVDGNGNQLGYAGALNELENVIRRQATAGKRIDFEALGDSKVNNGMLFKKHPRFDFLKDVYDDIQEDNFQEDLQDRNLNLVQIKNSFYKEAADRGYVYSDQEIKTFRQRLRNDAYTEGEISWLDDYHTSTRRDIDEDRKGLTLLRQKKKYLVESDLAHVHPQVYREFISQVRADEPRVLAESSFDSQFEKEANALANKLYEEEVGNDEKTNQWYAAQRRFKDELLKSFDEKLNTMPARAAFEDAVGELVTKLGGESSIPEAIRQKYTASEDIKADEAFALKVAESSEYIADVVRSGNMSALERIMLPNTQKELEQLVLYNKSNGNRAPIPELYVKIARGVKGLDAWTIANAQYIAFTGDVNGLGKGPSEEARDSMSPALRAAMDYKPTRSKIFRSREDVDYTQLSLSNASTYDSTHSLRELVMSGEGGFTSANRGIAGDSPGGIPDLHTKTISEWRELYNQGWNALGAPQFISSTFVGAVSRLNLPDDTVMTPDTQMKLLDELLLGGVKRPRLSAYLNGTSNDIKAAAEDFSLEFASAPNPYTGITSYPGVGGNAASMRLNEVYAVLRQVRERISRQKT